MVMVLCGTSRKNGGGEMVETTVDLCNGTVKVMAWMMVAARDGCDSN